MLCTSTDSLIYKIKHDVYENFNENKSLFNLSDYPEDLKVFDSVNKKVIGKMRDKIKGKIISNFVELKSKMYSLIVVDIEEIKWSQ